MVLSLALKNGIKPPTLPTPQTSILNLFILSNSHDLVMFLRKIGKIVKIDEKWKNNCQKLWNHKFEKKKKKKPSECFLKMW